MWNNKQLTVAISHSVWPYLFISSNWSLPLQSGKTCINLINIIFSSVKFIHPKVALLSTQFDAYILIILLLTVDSNLVVGE